MYGNAVGAMTLAYMTDVKYFFPERQLKFPVFHYLRSLLLSGAGDTEGARRATGVSPAGRLRTLVLPSSPKSIDL
jgi:hypothetical protein